MLAGPERLAAPRRAAPRGRRLAGRGPRVDERDQGQRPARGPPAAAPGRPDHDRRDGPDLRARLADGRAARGRAQVRLPRRPLPLPPVGGAQRRARPRPLQRQRRAPSRWRRRAPGRRARAAAPEPRAGVRPAADRGGRDGPRAGHDLRRGRRRDVRARRRGGHTRGGPVRVVVARAHLRPRRRHVPRGHGVHQRHLPERAPGEVRRAAPDGATRSASATANTATRSSRVALRIVEQAGRTDVGRQRTANEDSLVVRPPLFAVADGMGGAKAGEVASAVAVEAVERARESGEPAEAQLAGIVRDGQPAHLRPRGGGRVAAGHGHHAHARQGPRRRGEPGPRGRQPRLPHARRRARSSSRATTRWSRSSSGAARSRPRPPSTTRSARSSRARSAPSRTSRWTPTRSPGARATSS